MPDDSPPMRTRATASLGTNIAILVAIVCGGCGAKTGLAVPDLGPDAGPPTLDIGLDAGVDADIPCIEIPFDGGPVEAELETQARVGRADVVFLIDRTLSMSDEIATVRARLRDDIAPAIREAIPDSQLAVASFADFPVSGYGSATDGDTPFTLHAPSRADIASVQGAVDSIELSNGRDRRESQVEALYQLATGEGIGPYVSPSVGCPAGGRGYACLRTDALPVVLLFTDAQFHEDPAETGSGYVGITPEPHSWFDAVRELNRIGARVIGFDSGEGTAEPPLERMARATGALDGTRPLVFDIGAAGQRLTTGVVGAIRTFASSAVQDVSVEAVDPDRLDGVDVLAFVGALIPVRAEPSSGIDGIDASTATFLGVRAGTQLFYSVELRNDIVAPGMGPQRFDIDLIFRGDGSTFIARQRVTIVVPGADGTGCEGL